MLATAAIERDAATTTTETTETTASELKDSAATAAAAADGTLHDATTTAAPAAVDMDARKRAAQAVVVEAAAMQSSAADEEATTSRTRPEEPSAATDADADAGDFASQAARHAAQGRAAMASGDTEAAVAHYGCASDIMGKLYGPDAPECAEILFRYGQSLFANAVKRSGVLGDSVAQAGEEQDPAAAAATAAGAGVTAASSLAMAAAASGRFVFEGDGDDEDDEEPNEGEDAAAEGEKGKGKAVDDGNDANDADGADGGAEEEEDESPVEYDMRLAWETLDLSRVIYLRMGPSHLGKVADVLLALGDVSLELGLWNQAIDDLKEAARLKEETQGAASRELAEALYKLALAYEFAEDYPEAIVCAKRVVTVLEAKCAALKADEATGGDSVKEELEDIASLLPDILAKIEELEADSKRAEEMKAAARAAISASSSAIAQSSSSSSSTTAASSSSQPINDVTGLVKKKVKPDVTTTAATTTASVEATAAKRKAADTEEVDLPVASSATNGAVDNESSSDRPREVDESGANGSSAKRVKVDDESTASA